ncbi:MAG TPA: transporter associated domain-containing protein, partial [Thermomonas sp.]|nr:transporter associated domain-containing protein [Thermomonas sp.]
DFDDDEYDTIGGLITAAINERFGADFDDDEYDTIGGLITAAINERFGADFDDDEYDTIGGLITAAIGHLPEAGEELTLGRFQFRVARADGRRLIALHVVVHADA